jgi:hypothetical protein
MKGVQFVFDDKGEKTAVVIDLKKHSELWEDFYDAALVRQREDEPRGVFRGREGPAAKQREVDRSDP